MDLNLRGSSVMTDGFLRGYRPQTFVMPGSYFCNINMRNLRYLSTEDSHICGNVSNLIVPNV